MRQIRLFALALISFFATIIGSFLSPGTFLHRALSVATCTVFSFNSTLCAANLARWGDRVVAANPPAVVAQGNACGSGTVTQPTMQRGKDGTMYQVYYDFRRGKETVNSAACGREYWISPNSKHPLYGIRFVYLVNGQRNRVVPTLYFETTNGSLKVYDNNVAAARLPNPFSPDLGIASNPNPTRPQVNRPSSSQPAQSQSRPQVDTPSQNPNSSNNSSRPAQNTVTRTITFAPPSINQLSSDTFEINQISPEGCKSVTKIKKKENQIYQEYIKFSPSSTEACGLKPFSARLKPNDSRIELQMDNYSGVFLFEKTKTDGIKVTYKGSDRPPESLVIEKINNQSARVIYENPTGNTELGILPLQERGINSSGTGKAVSKVGVKQNTEKLCDFAKGVCGQLAALSKAVLIYTAGLGALANLSPAVAAALANPATAAAVAALTGAMIAGGAAVALADFGCWFMFGGGLPPIAILPEGILSLNNVAYTASGDLADQSGINSPIDQGLASFRKKLGIDLCDKDESKPQTTGNSYGDPHMITFDGFKYSFQTVGEFTLVKSTNGNFEVQARQGAISNSVSMNTAVAMKIGNSRVALYAKNPPDTDTSTPLRVDGKPTKLENGTLELPGGGKIQGNSSYYLVTAPTGEQVGVNMGNGRMDIKPYISGQSGQYIGLLGNANGNPADDLQTRTGKVIPTKENSTYGQVSQALRNLLPVPAPLNQAEKIFFDVVYKEFGDSWRISQAESLFDYPPGKDTGTFTNRSFPNSYLSLNSLLPPQIRKAEAICWKAGVESELMDGCIFDVGQTGDASFAQSAANALLDTAKDRLLQQLRNKVPVPSLPVPFKIPGLRL